MRAVFKSPAANRFQAGAKGNRREISTVRKGIVFNMLQALWQCYCFNIPTVLKCAGSDAENRLVLHCAGNDKISAFASIAGDVTTVIHRKIADRFIPRHSHPAVCIGTIG